MPRLIDRIPQPETILEKKIIVLSRSRVGTFSMYQSFKMLGMKPYHMYECVYGGVTHMSLFQEALRNKYYGEGKPYNKADFDKWLANYDFFIDEFIEFYPNAKFILTERNPVAWDKSINHIYDTVTGALGSFPINVVQHIDAPIGAFASLNLVMFNLFFHGRGSKGGIELAKADMISDGEKARRLLPKNQLLSVMLEDGFGWEEICPFLGVPIPNEKYPRGNAPAEFDKLLGSFIGGRLLSVGFKAVGSVVVPAVAIGAWYYTKQR
ncbi:hypothetical protein NQ176_g3631 [Zarea fungicola]|uniref:Uncharacterized protein n=1 Tax=Zarea fungicola TaxID=93591 RepID=A0ACC1NJJ5_9HYPO|nr:hypothetical protein NQ176_g3631 [Lecanicillium fungicola]